MNSNKQHKHYENDKKNKNFKKDSDTKYNCYQDDFISNRLMLHEKESLDLECNLVKINCILKQACKEETECWIELSSLVRSKKSIGFPLLRGYKSFSSGKILYFEQFKNTKVEKLLVTSSLLQESILFQIAVILYSMHKREIYVDNFEFDIVDITKTTFFISVNQIVFEICTDKLVILSLCTRPYKVNLPQSCYLNFLHCLETTMRKSYETSNYFFEWLIKNHISLLSKDGTDLFKIRKRTITTNHINRFVEPGTIVLVYRDDMYISGITLTDISISDNVRVLFSLDGGYILEIDDFNIQDVFLANEYFIRSQLTSIII
ncbi:early transcription protein [Goatpox virus]|uniref:Early transcription protein n=1 Tax=Goatpox virus TaxID=186805 RepID=A0A5C0PTV1_9POXV|nr:early transcription protein [Goatpox virus]QEJ79510.1 early transcription protein [Goatpox virus]